MLGITELMRGCNGLKYKRRGPGDETGDKHRQPHWQALQQEITLWKLEEGFKLEEVLLFLRFVIKSLWFQLGKQRCLANMLLPAFWQAKPFTTTRLRLLH